MRKIKINVETLTSEFNPDYEQRVYFFYEKGQLVDVVRENTIDSAVQEFECTHKRTLFEEIQYQQM